MPRRSRRPNSSVSPVRRSARPSKPRLRRFGVKSLPRRQPTRPSLTPTTTTKRQHATPSSIYCFRKRGGRLTSRRTANSRSPACPITRARALSTMCCGVTTASRSASWKPSGRDAMRGSVSSRPSSMRIASKSSSDSGRSFSTRTGMSIGCGTTRDTRRARCKGF